MRNKKIISAICALAMIFSMFASFSVSAAATKGITLDASLSKDAKTLTVVAKSFGVADTGVTSVNVVFDIPDGVDAEKAAVASTAGGKDIEWNFNIADGQVLMNWFDSSGKNPAKFDNDVLATITLPYSTAIDKNFTLKLDDTATIEDANGEVGVGGEEGMADSTITVESPLAKPAAGGRGSKQNTESDEPSVVPVPADVAKKGISLEASMSKDNKTLTVVAKALNVDEAGISSVNVVFDVPATADAEKASYVSKAAGKDVDWNFNIADNQVLMNWFDSSGKNPAKFDDGVLATVTIPLKSALTEDFAVKLDDTATLEDANGEVGVGDEGMTQVVAVAEVTEEAGEVPPSRPVEVKDYTGKDGSKTAAEIAKEIEDDAAKAAEYGDLYLTVKVEKDDPNNAGQKVEAKYGEDYVAEYNGKELSKAEYENLINGYTDDKMSDVINGLKLKVFNTAKGVTVNSYLNAVNKDDALTNLPETATVKDADGNTGNNDYSEKGKIASNVSTSIKSNADKQVATFTVTPAKDEDGKELTDGSKVTITVTKDSYDAVTGTGIAVGYNVYKDNTTDTEVKYVYPALAQAGEEVELPSSVDNKYIVEFTPAKKGTVQYKMTYYDANGDKSEATAEYKISEATTKSGGGSDNKSSGGGAIATGLVDSGSGYIPSLGFDDLGDVEWAQNAINTLAAKKIVSGVGDNKFDPNAALTRAAYAQMLVNAIGHSQDSADVEFDDVPTDAWFYHNVAVAAQLGIVAGFGDGTFRPYDLITREQMALMTQKAAVVMGKSLVGADAGTFTDDADIADWSRDAVYQLSNAGIINGMGDGSFAPQANATRAQAAVIIYQAFVK